MHSRLVAGLAGLQILLPEAVLVRELAFLEELLHWNRQINLTSVRDFQEAQEKHLLDSLALLGYLPTAGILLDMGSGGGLPGIPLAIACSALQVVSVDSVGKKINFQNHVKRRMGLENLIPIQARMEALDQKLRVSEKFDMVVTRAFSSFEQILTLAAPWLKEGGGLFAMKGPEGEGELLPLKGRLDGFGFKFDKMVKYRLPFSLAERQLISFRRAPSGENMPESIL